MSDGVFIVGVGGGTGSGKSTLVRGVVEAVGGERIVVVEHDWYYRDVRDLSAAERAVMNYDHPDSLETGLLVRHLVELRADREVQPPIYDYATHMRNGLREVIKPAKVIIVEGILVLACEELRGIMDAAIFVDSSDEIRLRRRVERDVVERGRTKEAIIEQYNKTVAPMHREFVEPSKECADLVVDGEDIAGAVEEVVSLLRSRGY